MKKYLLLIIFIIAFVLANSGNGAFRFIVVGDRTGSHMENVFEEIIDEVKSLSPDFIINVGDIIEGYESDTLITRAQWDTILSIVKKLPCHFYFVPGNHDIESENDKQIFEDVNNTRHYYSFDFQNNHFIVLDNSMTQFGGDIDSAQLEWLKQDLEVSTDKNNIFVFFHVPTWSDSWGSAIADTVEELLKKYGVCAVFSGHHHTYTYLEKDKIKYITLSSSGGGMDDLDSGKGNLYSYLLVTVKGKSVSIVVIKKGSILPADFFTFEDNELVRKAQQEAFELAPRPVKEQVKNVSQNLKISVRNFSQDSIVQPLKWTFEPGKYTITPAIQPLSIGPLEKKNLEFKITTHNGSDIYPIPQFFIVYPYRHSKTCTLKIPALTKRIAVAIKTKIPPVIDGILDDAIWKKAKPITNLGSYDGIAPLAIEKTEIYLTHDKENFYLAARCYESDFNKLKADAREHDGATYTDDNIWFFFDSDFDQETYYQVIINGNGYAFDRLCSLKDGKSTKDVNWNGPWKIKSGKENDAWTLEIKIPKKGLEPFNEKQWGFNFRRLQPRLGQGYWSLPFGHDPKNFGIIELK